MHSKQDLDLYLVRQTELFARLKQVNADDEHTMISVIRQIVEVTRPLVESGYYPWKQDHFATFIDQTLEDNGINYPRGETFYNLFTNKEQKHRLGGTNFLSPEVIHEHDYKPHPHFNQLGNCECGALQFGGLTYDVKQPEVVKVTKPPSSKPTIPPTPPTDYLRWVRDNCEAVKEYCMELIDKHKDPEDAKVIDSALESVRDIDDLIIEQKSLRAKIKHMTKQSDFRQRIGEFEKIKAILAQTVINLSKVAAVLDISPKHLSKNVLQNLPTYRKNMEWFKALQIPVTRDMKKGEFITIENFATWYNEQLKRKDIPGLDMVQLNVY